MTQGCGGSPMILLWGSPIVFQNDDFFALVGLQKICFFIIIFLPKLIIIGVISLKLPRLK